MKAQESSPGYDVLAQSASADEWTLVPLKELGTWSGGGTPSKSKLNYWEDGTISWVSPKDMKSDHIVDSEDHITQAAVEESTAKLIPAGSVLIVTRSGILSHTLPVAVTTVPVTVNQDLKALTPREGVLPEYVAWALRCFAREILNTCSKQGTTVSSIETAALHRFEIPVAPLVQQNRIVAEIEKQFSRLDEAVANLKRVKANLKRYKAAVLKAAVEGRLVETEAELARREGRSYETGAQLLQRILETRRSQWQGKGKYKEPAAPDTTGLPELPEGWTWCGFEQVSASGKHALKAGPFGSALKKEMYVESGYKIYGQEQVISGDPTFGDYFIDEEKYRELESCAVKPGDLLISLVGTAGKVLVLPPTALPGIINPRLLKLSLNQAFIAPAYAAYMLQSAWAKHYFKLQAHGGTMEILNLGIIKALPVPLPALDEQHRIVAEVDRRLSILRETETQVDADLKRAISLRQGVLRDSFTGRVHASIEGGMRRNG